MASNQDLAGNGKHRAPAHTIEDALALARAAIHRGELARGQQALAWVLKREPGNRAAWFWMACCVSDEGEKADCYRRAGT